MAPPLGPDQSLRLQFHKRAADVVAGHSEGGRKVAALQRERDADPTRRGWMRHGPLRQPVPCLEDQVSHSLHA
jgi:hypothetical protein